MSAEEMIILSTYKLCEKTKKLNTLSKIAGCRYVDAIELLI